ILHGAIQSIQRMFNGDEVLRTTGFLNQFLSGHSFFGIGKGLMGGLNFLTSAKGIGLSTAAIALLSFFFRDKPDPDTTALATMNDEVAPSVWNDGPALLLTAGLTLSSMGINLGPSAPLTQTLTVPQVQLTAALSTATNGSMPDDSERYASIF